MGTLISHCRATSLRSENPAAVGYFLLLRYIFVCCVLIVHMHLKFYVK